MISAGARILCAHPGCLNHSGFLTAATDVVPAFNNAEGGVILLHLADNLACT
jgi:hypothetical protein